MEVNPGIKRTAAMVILCHEDKFLLLKRTKPPNKGHFTPIGGKLDPYESPESAARRETMEETGLKLGNLTFAGYLIESSPTNYNWNSLIFLSLIQDMEPPKCDEGTLHWIHIKDLDHLHIPPTDFEIYQYVIQNKPFMFDAIYDEQLNLVHFKELIENRIVI